ncbi:MAG TPA: hypothetical protein VLH08_06490 [Acidobacteriota bacterium]|nr:hypothetical protein [Acidobacteriota bacterium]
MSKILAVLIFTAFVIPIAAIAQEELTPSTEENPAASTVPPDRSLVKLRDFQTILITSLRQEFPRLPGVFYSAHSCRLPEYGPVVSMTLQLPVIYFTRPLMQELGRRQKMAEEQAKVVRSQIERAATVIRLRSREAELVERINLEDSAKKKNKINISSLQTELGEVRKNLADLDAEDAAPLAPPASELFSEVDLEKMLATSYQQLIEKITSTVRNVLAEKAAVLGDLKENERITVTAHIRESFVSNQERSIIFTLNNTDIESFRAGILDLNGLKQKVQVRNESPE